MVTGRVESRGPGLEKSLDLQRRHRREPRSNWWRGPRIRVLRERSRRETKRGGPVRPGLLVQSPNGIDCACVKLAILGRPGDHLSLVQGVRSGKRFRLEGWPDRNPRKTVYRI